MMKMIVPSASEEDTALKRDWKSLTENVMKVIIALYLRSLPLHGSNLAQLVDTAQLDLKTQLTAQVVPTTQILLRKISVSV